MFVGMMEKLNGSAARQNEIYNWIENAIFEVQLRPGDVIDEQELCRRFDVSRTPVREALLQLASRQLVTFLPRKGAIVTKLSVQQIILMWEVLSSLESICCELAARRMSAAEREALKCIHEESKRFLAAVDSEGYAVGNREFHHQIHEGARNSYLVGEIRELRLRLRSYGRRPYERPGGLKVSFAGHARILQAILDGDPQGAATAMRDHVSGGLALLDFLAEASEHVTA